MLYNLIFLAVAMLIPLTGVLAYRQGIRDGRAVVQDKPLTSIIKTPKQKPKISAEDKRLGTILDNINSYDGSATGQKEV